MLYLSVFFCFDVVVSNGRIWKEVVEGMSFNMGSVSLIFV